MEEIDVKIKCKKCNQTFLIEEPIFICPNCESFDTKIVECDELHIVNIEEEKN